MQISHPLFITGVQRSGTTLLRTILCAHPDIWVSYECAAYKIVADQYRDGILRDQIDAFVVALCSVRRFDLWHLESDNIRNALIQLNLARIPFRTAIDLVATLNLQAFKPDAKVFGFKNPHGIYHLPYIWELYPNARVINIVRDPRGILASEKSRRNKTAGFKPASTINTVAKRYARMVGVHKAAQGDPRYMCLNYSDLVSNFEPTIAAVLSFIGVDFNTDVLDYDRNARSNTLTPQSEMYLHARTLQKPDPARLFAFRDALTVQEQAALESLSAGDMKSLLGLDPDHGAVRRLTSRVTFLGNLLKEKGAERLLKRRVFAS